MHVKRLSLADFETRSVALFSAFLVGAVLAATGSHAQTPAPSPSELTPRAPRLTVAQVQQAFRTIDANRDGAISRAEAGAFPRIERHFGRMDNNDDGSVSPAEFAQALQQASS